MLNNIGPMGFLLIAIVVLVLFGRGKIAGMMGEVGKGITAFRKGMDDGKREIEDATAVPPASATTADHAATSRMVPPQTVVRDVTPAEERDRA